MPIPWTKESFIEKSKKVHGDNSFDYSKVVWKNTSTDVILVCKNCGMEFSVNPDKHINRRRGCDCQSLCKKRTYKSFLEEVSLKYPKYFQSVSITNNDELNSLPKGRLLLEKTDIVLKCKKCGHEWHTNAKRILNGQGCPKCAGKCETTESFLCKLKENCPEIFENIEVLGEYSGSHSKISVKCKKCGRVWKPIAYSLLNGNSRCLCNGGKIHKHNEDSINKKLESTEWECVSPNEFRCKKCGEKVNMPYKTMLTQGCHCPSCDDNARWHTAVYYENELKKKFGDDISFVWENNNQIKKNTDILTVYRNGNIVVKKQLRLIRNSEKIESKNLSIDEVKTIILNILAEKNFILIDDLENITNQNEKITCRCNVCGTVSSFKVANVIHRSFGCRRCKYDSVKRSKFNLLKEFENEYALRAFLANNDVNILFVILRNIEPKFEPIKNDVEFALLHRDDVDPIQYLVQKYSTETNENEDNEENTETIEAPVRIDLDNDDDIYSTLNAVTEENNEEPHELTIEDIIRNDEQEIQVVNRIEHMLTPEIRNQIMSKFLNDKMRFYISQKERFGN